MCFQEKDPHDFETQANNLYQKAPAASGLISLSAKQQRDLEPKVCDPPHRRRNYMTGGHSLNTGTN